MAKEIRAKVKMQIPGGGATPAPPVGSALGPYGVKTMDFCKLFNAQTAGRKGETVPVVVTVYKDKTFDFEVKTSPTSELIKKAVKIQKGSSTPNTKKVGSISSAEIEKIAAIKMPDLNAVTMEEAKRIIAGSARSMGVEIVD